MRHPPLPVPRTGPLTTSFRPMVAAATERMGGSPRPMQPARVRRVSRPPFPPAIVTEESPSEPDPLVSTGTADLCSGCLVGDQLGSDLGTDVPAVGSGGPGEGETDIDIGVPLRVSSGVDAPAKLVHVDPRYPELARRAGVQGVVVLECVIDPAGNMANVEIRSGHPLLRPAAVEAVRQWSYTPTRLNGVPVAVVMTVTVQFRLRPTTP